MAYADTLDVLFDEIFEHFKAVYDLYREAVQGILPYRDKKSGLFYQIIDKGEINGNYTESSGSAMVAYSILKGCNKGFLPCEKYLGIGKEIFDSLVCQKLKNIDGKPHLTDICLVAGLGPGDKRDGSIQYYLSEKTGSDDSKGVGPFMMAYAQYLKAENR